MSKGTILAVDDTLVSLDLLSGLLHLEGYQVLPANSGELALAAVAVKAPDLILLDLIMPGMDGFEVLRRLKANECTRGIPVVMLSAVTEIEQHVQALRLGAVDFVSKPFQREELLARVKTHVELYQSRVRLERQAAQLQQSNGQLKREMAERQKAQVLLRESEQRFRSFVENINDVLFALTSTGVFTYVSPQWQQSFGYELGETIGQSFLPFVHPEDVAGYMAFMQQVFVTGQRQSGVEYRVRCKDGRYLWYMANASLAKDPVDGTPTLVGIGRDMTQLKEAREQVHQLAFYDPLTNLPNRRLLGDRLNQSLAASRRSGRCGVLMFLDLDNFKSLNDRYGHSVGDLLLIEVAVRLRHCLREIDTVARFGGDEFVVLLSEVNAEKTEASRQAGILAEKVRDVVSEPYLLRIKIETQEQSIVEHQCSVSTGVVVFSHREGKADDIVRWADAAMYQAKEAGRNLVQFHAPGD